MIRVLIVDDHPVVHDGVAAVLNRTPDIRLVHAVETVEQAIAVLTAAAPDVVLLDIRLAPVTQGSSAAQRTGDGLTAIGSLLAARADLRIIMFSAYDADEYVFGAIRAGARGYVLKGAPGAEMIDAIRRVHGGESFLSPRLGARIIDQLQARSRGSRVLTPREMMVLKLMAAGLSNREIAGSLAITERTVKFHVTAILNKLGADNRTQAVAMADRRGLLPPDQV